MMTSQQSHVVPLLILILASNFQSTLSQVVGNTPDCLHELSYGSDPHVERPKVDNARSWTIVMDAEFPQHGLLTSVRFFAKATNRPLEIGIYRPQGRQCEYKLIKEYRFDKSKIRAGYNELSIPNDEWMVVQPGDHYGFTWLSKGVVAYTKTDEDNQMYCDRSGSLSVGQTKRMNRRNENRIYSLSVMYTTYSSSLTLDVGGQGSLSAPDFQTPSPFTYISPVGFKEHAMISSVTLNVHLSLPSTTFKLCTNKAKSIKCKSSKKTLGIVSAYYAGVEDCVADARSSRCQKLDALDVIRKACQGKRSCTVRASSRSMGSLPCAEETKQVVLEVTYTCQDASADNLANVGDANFVEGVDVQRISAVNEPSGFTYLRLEPGEICSEDRYRSSSDKTPQECGLECDLDPECEGFEYEPTGRSTKGTCWFVSDCKGISGTSVDVSGYRKSGDLVLAVYKGLENPPQGSDDRGGKCRLRIQTAAVVKNLASGIQQVTFENAAVEEGSQVGVTFLTSSLHRMRVSASHQTEFPTSCEREELPYKTWFNYYKGDGSYTYDLKVEYVGSTCKQLSGFGVASDVSILPIIDDDCKDTELHPGTCLKYQQAGNCEKSTEHYMAKRYCQRTCGLCHVTRPTCSPGQIYRPDSNLCEAHCVDSRGNCKNYPARGLCSKRSHIRRCPVSCGACPMSCSRGYTLKNGRCVDINECTKNRGICPANARCVNRQGYYECICRSAYSFAEIHTHLEKGICRERKCVDKKSATYCNRYKKRCFDPKRQAAMLSFCKKTCDLCDVDCNQEGYMINPEKQCVDINECLRKDLFRCGRDAKCNNTDGSYECVCTGDKPLGNPKRRCLAECQEGYRLVGTKCRRINPCTHGLHQCPQNARCQVTKTSYRCRCPLGTTDVVDKATGQHRCIKEMMCRASGDPHFYTFDSTKIDFMGICVYTLVSTQCPGHITALPAGFVPFTVDIKNQHRNGKTRVSFLQYIEVEIGEDTVRLDQKGVVWINSQKVQLPYLPEEAVYTIQNEANNVVFRMTSGGLRIVWSGSTTVYVYIDESYGGHVCGLCGNADGDRRNDMMTREGELVKSDAVVGDSWRVPHKGGETCTTVTNESPQCTDAQNQRFAEACGAIAEGAFTACHDKVPPEEIIEECTFDLCAELEGTPEVGVEEAMLTILCSYYQDYADLCIFKGVLVEWNKDGVCPHNPECPVHSVYSHSVTCSPSCADPYGESCLDHPVGGCQCGEDFVQEGMSPMTCVHLEQCGCIHNEIYHSLGETWLNADCSEKYKCVGYKTIEAWGVDCDEEAAVCSDTIPVFNVVQKHGCYCRSQNTNAGITTCDEEIPDTNILIQDPDDEEEEEEGVIIDEIGTPVVDPFPYPGTPVVDPFPFPGFPQHDEPVVLPVVDPIDDEVIIIDDIVHCQDLLSSDVCETYKANGNCRNMGQLWMSKKYCQNTCGMCDITRPKCNEGEIYRHDTNLCEAHCQDILDDCAAVLDSGKCNTRFGRVRCPITCGVCEPSCSHGYRLEDGKCVDINECDQEDICPTNARCANRLGFYICLCLRGYEYSEIYSYTTRQGVCTEQDCADKRSEKHCTTHQERCFDPRLQPIMLRYCKKSCDLCGTQCDKEGYMINQEKECVDIDECSRKDLFRCGRDAKCTNTDGAYKCECTGDKPEGDPKRRCFAECEEGYERRGARCVRINPCTSGLHTCPENAPCQRTRTSYRCRCPKGLTDVIDAETEKHKCIKEFNCVARGDPHYYTFDGVKIDWQGVCPYQLLGTDCPAHIDPLPQDQPHFNLYVKNQHRNGRTRVSFLQYIDAELGDDKVRLDQGGRVYVNSDPVELPYQTLVYEVHFEGNSVVLKSKVNGFKVIWSTTTSVSIYIDEQYQGHVCGICGNADYNETNDMMTKQGELVTSEVMVGDSWRVPGEDGTECEEVTQEVPKCTADDNERFAAECGFITHEPFAACNPVVSPENYMKECMFDLCAETEGHLDTVQLAISVETLCDHYKYYADKCLTEGVLISWEKETLCPNHPQCPENSRYNHNKTCTLSCADPYGWDCLDEHSGGCQCNPGYLQDGDSPMTCVLPHQCGCMDGDKYYSVGKFWYNSDCTEKYKCIGHNNVNIWEIDCNEEAAVCGHTVPVFDVVTNRGCYCRNQPTEGVVQTCDEVITGPTEIVEEPEDDIEIFPPFDPGNDQPFPPFDPGNDQPFPPFDPGNDQPLPSATTESNQPFPPFDPGNDSPVLPFNPGNDQPIPDVDDETETDEPIQSGEPTTYIPVLPQEPVWDYNNGIIPPRLNDSEDNSYFQLQPEPTPQLKPRPLGMESCVIKQSYLSASSEQYGGEAYRARPLSCNSNQPPSGWQPEEEDSDPYLQIDLGTSVPVHGIGTLGHYNKTCWVEKYKVYVSNSDDEDSFVALKDKDTGMDRIFDGNHDQNTWRHYCYHRYYGNPVTARYIRLVPLDQTVCTAMRVELYGFRKSDDPQLIDALQTDAWTKNTSGCQCYFDASRSDCACCEEGGCQCPRSNRHQCVQCGYSANCGIPEQNDDSNQVDPWTKSPDGCPCPENPSDFGCACCQKYSCQCGGLQPNQCVQCGHTEQHCGLKPEVFGPPPVCVPKSCP